MTNFPDYLLLMALRPTGTGGAPVHRPATEVRELRSTALSLRVRIGRRLTRRAAVSEPAFATRETVIPALRDYPYRASC
jgi:hypothetical protein